jgi:uncharacterized protein (DUF2252 family)
MPLEHPDTGGMPGDAPLTVGERRVAGQELRKRTPRSLHATWTAPADRPDPVQSVIESGRHRIASLLPIRNDRMRQSPFGFLCGAAALMAADLATTPVSGLRVQACGDCHHGNFVTFASAEGTPVFDVNDFDETLPAPFEWDLKRLATGLAVDARERGMADKSARNLARTAIVAYRTHMQALVRLSPLEVWRSRIDLIEALAAIEDPKLRDREMRRVAIAVDASRRSYPKLLERVHGRWRIREKPPLVFPLSQQSDDTHEIAARTAFHSYRRTLEAERRVLLDRYRLADVAFKVVGVGSVGLFCAIGLFVTADEDAMLLQIKEAQASVLEAHVGRSVYANAGERVVVGQRMMQATPDPLLGWTRDGGDQHCYVRTLRDQRLSDVGAQIAEAALPYHVALCGRALARAHARTGDPAMLAGYMGSGGVFDAAIADFAMAYADQTERDWRLFREAVNEGLVEARTP